MPRQIARLTRAEGAEYLLQLQQLQAEGLDVRIPLELLEHYRILNITVGDSLISESQTGQPYYAVQVRLVALRPVTLADVEMSVPWDDDIDFGCVPEKGNLCLHDLGRYSRKEVLNSRISDFLRFHRRDQVVEGWILATGIKPIPKEYRTGARVPCQLCFRDPLGRELAASVELSVLRTSKSVRFVRRNPSDLYEPLVRQVTRPQLRVDMSAHPSGGQTIKSDPGGVSVGDDPGSLEN